MAKTKIDKPIRAVQLTIWITPQANGKPKVNSTIKFKSKDKQTAIELIKQYVKINERENQKVDA